MLPKYPIYVVSKGRWQQERRLTIRALEQLRVPYYVIVEAQEAEAYAVAVTTGTILVLDPVYQRDYETCDSLGDSISKGSGPARNMAGDHAQAGGAAWHWVVDDNIHRFYRLNRNMKIQVLDGAFFRVMESFCDRYENVAMAGPNYESFVVRRDVKPPFTLNTRVYSCNLLRGGLPFRWRGRYNEDTILSLDMLKAGWCTVLFNAYLQNKVATQRMPGGNTDALYRNGTLEKSEMLVHVHPDVARLTWRFNRWHHYVDYRPFKRNRLIRRPGVEIPAEPNEYGMQLVAV